MQTERKTSSDLRAELAEAKQARDATMATIEELEGGGDSSTKTAGALANRQAALAIHAKTCCRLDAEIAEAERTEAEDQISEATEEIAALNAELESAISAAVDKCWPHLRLPETAGPAYDARRRAEITHLAKSAHGAAAIRGRIDAARSRFESAKRTLNRA